MAYYRAEEGTGNSIIDSVSSSAAGSHNAAYSSSVGLDPIPQTGSPNNYSLSFNNSASATITAQSFILHSGYGEATLEFWLNPPNQSHSSIFWTRGNNSDANRFNISINPGGSILFDYREPGGALHNLAGLSVPVDAWTHVAVTREVLPSGSHVYSYYRDGSFVTSAADGSPNLPTATTWTISGRSGYQLQGLIDEIRFSDEVLSPSQFLISIPEPSCLTLLGLGVFGMSRSRQRMRRAAR